MTEIEYSVQSRNVRLKKIHIPLPKWMAPPALKMIPSCLVEEEPASIAPICQDNQCADSNECTDAHEEKVDGATNN